MREITQVDILSVAKIYAAIALVFSLAFFLPWVLIAGGMSMRFSPMGMGMMVMMVFMPIAYVVAAFVAGVVFAWLYNVLATRIGGIEIQLAPSQAVPTEPETHP